MKIANRGLRWAMFAAMAALALASAVPSFGDRVLDENRVLYALAVAHVPVRSASVEFLAPVTLRQPRATLKLAHMEKAQGDAALARISCPVAGECVPFFVLLHWSDPIERQSVLGSLRPRPIHVETIPHTAKPFLVRAGQSATLLLQNNKMRIATPIICLQNGSQGQQIRVSSLDHKRVVLAEVVDSGVLKGNL